jgi:hypothetical protein
MLRQSGIAKVFVMPRLDGLVIQTINEDGTFQQVSHKNPAWYPQFRQNPITFVEDLAKLIPRRLPEALWDKKGEMDLQYLFLRVLDDLNRVSSSIDDYDNLRIASLLRLLLLEEQPLVHKVNRIHKLPLSFFVGEVLINNVVDPATQPPPPTPRLIKTRDGRLFFAVGRRFDPQTSNGSVHEMSLDQFLRALVLKVEDHWVSVHDFISHMAYVEGLVHSGSPKAKRVADEALHRWRRTLHFHGRALTLETLAAIGRVACASLVALAFECDRALQSGQSLFSDVSSDSS